MDWKVLESKFRKKSEQNIVKPERSLTLFYDATSLGQRMSGLERYTEELLLTILPKVSGRNIRMGVLFSSLETAGRFPCRELGVQVLTPPRGLGRRLLRDNLWMPWIIRRHAPDMVFFPAFPPSPLVFPLSGRTRFVRTIHDAVSWKFPETISWKNRFYFRPFERIGLPRYDLILTVSRHSLSDLRLVFPLAANRMLNLGNAVKIRKGGADSPVLPEDGRTWRLPERYLLFVGTLEPRKNIPFLVGLMDDLRTICPELGLVIVGRDGWGAREVREAVGRSSSREAIILTGPVADAELRNIYSKASMMAFPSLEEGFGYPVLEALEWDCPVIANRIPAMEEVLGEKGLLISVSDRSGWIDAILRIVGDPSERERLLFEQKKILERFSWDSVAERFLLEVGRLGEKDIA